MPDFTLLQWIVFLVGVFSAAKALSAQYGLKALRKPDVPWQTRIRGIVLLDQANYTDQEAAAELLRENRTWILLLAGAVYVWKVVR